MFKVKIFTRLLRQECGWNEAWAEKLTRHLYRLGYQVRHAERDACGLVAEKELKTYHDPFFWLRALPELLDGFMPSQIIRRLEVFTGTPVDSGGTCHSISKPSKGAGFYGFCIGVNGCDNGSTTYLDIKDAEDFTAGLRHFENLVMMFTVMAEIFKDATKAKELIAEKHEYGGALRVLDDIRHRASIWSSALLV